MKEETLVVLLTQSKAVNYAVIFGLSVAFLLVVKNQFNICRNKDINTVKKREPFFSKLFYK